MFEELIRHRDDQSIAIDLATIRAIEPDKGGVLSLVHFKESATSKTELFDIPYNEMLEMLNAKNPSVYRKLDVDVDVKMSEMANLLVEAQRFVSIATHRCGENLKPDYNMHQLKNFIERLSSIHFVPFEKREGGKLGVAQKT